MPNSWPDPYCKAYSEGSRVPCLYLVVNPGHIYISDVTVVGDRDDRGSQ